MPRKTNFNINGHDYYRLTATIGKNLNGSRIRKQFLGKNKTEAESLRDEYINNIKSGLKTNYKDMDVQDLMKIWLFNVVKEDRAYNTFERYEAVYRNYVLNSPIAGLKVYDVQRLTLQTHYNKMKQNGYSDSQVYHLNKLLKTFFNYAVAEDYIIKNPCIGIKVTKNSKNINADDNKIDPFTDEEVQLIRNKAKGSMYTLFQLGLGTGLRRGELIGLRIKDIDLKNMQLRVNVTLKRVKQFKDEDSYEYVTLIDDSTKTANSVRTVPIPSKLILTLKEHIDLERAKHKGLGIPHNNNSLLFTSETCTPYCGKNILTAFERLLKRAGVRYRCFHNIRHTYATKLFEKRVPLITISKLLGHANTVITANVYISVMPKEKTDAAEELNYLFE